MYDPSGTENATSDSTLGTLADLVDWHGQPCREPGVASVTGHNSDVTPLERGLRVALLGGVLVSWVRPAVGTFQCRARCEDRIRNGAGT